MRGAVGDLEDGGVYFPVLDVSCRYRRPAYFDDRLQVSLAGFWPQLDTSIRLDAAANAADVAGERAIGAPDSAVALLVVPTDEEREIAEQSLAAHGCQLRPPSCLPCRC